MADPRSLQLKRAAEWKVFETQAMLLSDDVTPAHMDIARKWIQPLHYSEMIEERVGAHKCGLPTCTHMLSSTAPSSFRDIIDAVSERVSEGVSGGVSGGVSEGVTPVSAENTIGGAVNISVNYCSTVCFEKSKKFYMSLDASAPLTRKHATQLLSKSDITQALSDDNSAIDTILETLSVAEADTSLLVHSPTHSSTAPNQQHTHTTTPSLTTTSRVPPLINISRFNPDGSPIKRSPKPKTNTNTNKFTSSSSSSPNNNNNDNSSDDLLPDRSAYEKFSSPDSEPITTAKTEKSPAVNPITFIKSAKIPVHPVPKQSVDKNSRNEGGKVQQGANNRPSSPDSPTTKSASLSSLSKSTSNNSSSHSPVPHTDNSTAAVVSKAQTSKNAPKASLVLPSSFQQEWDSASSSTSRNANQVLSNTQHSESGPDSVAATMLRASSMLSSLTTPTLLSYDPVTSSLPPSHTPLASARRREDIIVEHEQIRSEDERQRQIQLQLKEEEKRIATDDNKLAEEKILPMNTEKESVVVSKQKVERERALKMSRPAPTASEKAIGVSEPSTTNKTVGYVTPSSRLNLNAKSNPEALKGILKLVKDEIPDESEDIVQLLEERVSDIHISGKKLDKAATRQQYIDSSKNEFGIYDRNSSDEDDSDNDRNDGSMEKTAKLKLKKKAQHANGTAGKPKLKLKPKSTTSKQSHENKKKTISFGEDSTRVFDKSLSVAASSQSIAERSVLNTKISSTSNAGGVNDKAIPNLELEGGVGRTRGGHPILSPKKDKSSSSVVMVDHSKYERGRQALDSESPESQLSTKGYNSRDGLVSENGVLMKHAVDAPMMSNFDHTLTPEEDAMLMANEQNDLDESFEDDLYGGEAGKRMGGGSSAARGKNLVDLSHMTPKDRDVYLVNKYREEENMLYNDISEADGKTDEPERKVQTPFFSDQLEEWLDGCEWGATAKQELNDRHPTLNKAYPSSYAALLRKKKAAKVEETEMASVNSLDWDSQMTVIERQEADRKAIEVAALKKKADAAQAALDAKTAEKVERARLRAEARKNDPDFIAKEKERRDQRSKLKREIKIKPLPAHFSPSAALRQAAKQRLEMDQASKSCPPKPRPRPVPIPAPRGLTSTSSSSNRPPNWHPPPPPVPKQVVVSSGNRNPVEKKRTVANENIMKLTIIEKDCDEVPEPLTRNDLVSRQSAIGEIEGYRPLYGTAAPPVVGSQVGSDEEKVEDELKDLSYVLSNHDVDEDNVMIVSPEEDVLTDGHTLTEDEKIWKEIFGADAKIPGSDDEDEDAIVDVKAEMNSILSQNFFLYMWTTLEDLFGCDVISWMNGEPLPHAAVNHAAPLFEDSNYMDPNDNRRVLSTSTQNVAHSLATLLYRAVQHAERSVDLNSLFESEKSTDGSETHLFTSEERREYHAAKQILLGRAEIRRANPAFNSMQWNFLGLLLVDVLLTRKVLNRNGERTHSPDQRMSVWNTHFSRLASFIAGGQDVLDSVLEPRELDNLRSFFDIDT